MRATTLRLIALAVLIASSPAVRFVGAQRGTPREIARLEGDFDGDGRRDTLSIRAFTPRAVRDTTPWCGAGVKDTGQFELRVSLARGRVGYTDLNALMKEQGLFFTAEPWKIVAADYNGDGRPDFNLGQYASCNGWQYSIFTVRDDASVARLELPGGPVRVTDFANSTKALEPVGRGFVAEWYDNSRGRVRALYCWSATARAFVVAHEAVLHDENTAAKKQKGRDSLEARPAC